MSILEKLSEIKAEAKKRILLQKTVHDLHQEKAKYLGKKGVMADFMKMMKDATIEERKSIGKASNDIKQAINSYIEEQKALIEEMEINAKLASETIDVTLPGKDLKVGTKHILTQTTEELEDLFLGMGYTIEEGPQIENDEYNFEKLNLPKDHPARDMQDTFYITDEMLLRPQKAPRGPQMASKGQKLHKILPK